MTTSNQKQDNTIDTENYINKLPDETQVRESQESLMGEDMKIPDYSYGFNQEGIEYEQGVDNAPDPFSESLLHSQ